MAQQHVMKAAGAVIGLLLAARMAGGAWDGERPVVLDPVEQFVSRVAVAPDDTLYVAWPDWTEWEDTKVTLTTSHDRGKTWSKPTVLFDGVAYDNLQLHADAAGLHLVVLEFTEDEENENKRPYYTRSVDDGVTFSEAVRVGTRNNIEATKLFSSRASCTSTARTTPKTTNPTIST